MNRRGEETSTSRGDATRTRILESALSLFRERGYEETTMRAVAEKAGVALGNAYYYFRSKEHLIQAFYERTHEEHLAACADRCARERNLQERLRIFLRAKIETSEPYHRFSGVLFQNAADPRSPLNPFSPESEPLRREVTRHLTTLLDGCSTRIPDDLRGALPDLLWLYLMGVILFWIHDESPNRRRTRLLIDRTTEIVAALVALGSNPLLRPVRRKAIRIVEDLRTA